jgi:hypothetical protein
MSIIKFLRLTKHHLPQKIQFYSLNVPQENKKKLTNLHNVAHTHRVSRKSLFFCSPTHMAHIFKGRLIESLRHCRSVSSVSALH